MALATDYNSEHEPSPGPLTKTRPFYTLTYKYTAHDIDINHNSGNTNKTEANGTPSQKGLTVSHAASPLGKRDSLRAFWALCLSLRCSKSTYAVCHCNMVGFPRKSFSIRSARSIIALALRALKTQVFTNSLNRLLLNRMRKKGA